MVVGFVSCVLSGVLRAALLRSGPLVCKLVSNVLWRAVWLGELSGYGSKKGGSIEPPIVGRFALSSVISTRLKMRDKRIYRAANTRAPAGVSIIICRPAG